MRRESIGVALMVLGVFAAYAWTARYWIDPVDEGYFLDLADRVRHGALPYRDFATYYTPGVFYLFALVLKLFGASVLPIRYLMATVRALTALLLYRLTRRCAPWPFAVLPFTIVATLDHWPIEPEPHPSWPAIVACLLTMELVATHLASARRRWLALAGAAAGVAFLFKQNTGAFTAIALAGYVILRPRKCTGGLVCLGRVLFALACGLVATAFLWPHLDVPTAGALWLPLLVTLALLVRWAGDQGAHRGALTGGLSDVLADGALAGGAFAVVTGLWLGPLAIALGPTETPISLFLGSVNQAGLEAPFAPLRVGSAVLALAVIWLTAALVASTRNQSPRATRTRLAIAAVLTLVVVSWPTTDSPRAALTSDQQLLPWLTAFDNAFGTLHLYVPALAAWAGVAALLMSDGRSDPRSDPGPWYLLFGTLAALTLYPRVDTAHVLVASPPILVAGAWALGRADRALRATARWRRLAVSAALLLVPVAALSAQVLWRVATFIAPEAQGPRLAYQPLGLSRAPVLVPSQVAADIHGVVDYIQAGTPPGAPVFVYPAAPLFNFLADRPNPSRFDHFLPGALTDRDFAEVIEELEHARPRYVLWDHRGVIIWETDPANRPLSDYLWRCYREVAAFDLYLVLERRTDSC